MKLLSYRAERGNGPWRGGALVDGRVVDTDRAAAQAELPTGDWTSVREIISRPDAELERLAQAVAAATASGVALDQVEVGPPVPDANKILCIGLNYLDHQLESQKEGVAAAQTLPKFPLVFNKFTTALIGPGATVEPPAATRELDFEAELAVVIGKPARNVALEDALDHVAGYAAFNDVSARDLQLRSPQWAIGKGFDTSGPFGPYLVTKDEIADVQSLAITGRLNGKVVQTSNTAQMIFPVAQLIEFISQAITLLPGDIIATGTPAGCGFARKPPLWMQEGDVFEVEIEQVGTLTSPIGAPGSTFVSRLEDEQVTA